MGRKMWSRPLRIVVSVLLTVALVASFRIFNIPRNLFLLLIATLFVAAVVLPYIFVPILLHRRHVLAVHAIIEAVSPVHDVLPQEYWDHVTETVDELAPLGFKLKGHF